MENRTRADVGRLILTPSQAPSQANTPVHHKTGPLQHTALSTKTKFSWIWGRVLEKRTSADIRIRKNRSAMLQPILLTTIHIQEVSNAYLRVKHLRNQPAITLSDHYQPLFPRNATNRGFVLFHHMKAIFRSDQTLAKSRVRLFRVPIQRFVFSVPKAIVSISALQQRSQS